MKTKCNFILMVFILTASLLFSQNEYTPDKSWISVNDIFMTVNSEGQSDSRIILKEEYAAEYMVSTADAIANDGIIWSGIVKDGQSPELRAGGNFIRSGTQPGAIVSRGLAESPDNSEVNRIWRVLNLDYFNNYNEMAIVWGLSPEDASYWEKGYELDQEYFHDFLEWPVSKGAPLPNNLNGTVDYADATQITWFVYNDYDSAKTMTATGSPPIGLEIQETIWAYTYAPTATRYFIVRQVRMFYKGTANTPDSAHIDSMYVGLCADFENGDPHNDLLAYDSNLDMAYVYNNGGTDAEYEKLGFLPSVFGCAFLKGPLAPEPYEQAQLGVRTVNGYRNIRASAFVEIPPDIYHALPAGQERTQLLRNAMLGYQPAAEKSPVIDPTTGRPARFQFSGDPATNSGWLDDRPGQKQMIIAAGPFSMALGDSNEFKIVYVVGKGKDQQQSFDLVKYHFRRARDLSAANFVNRPDIPNVNVTVVPYDGAVLLKWTDSINEYWRVEHFNWGDHRFEGYNVYQIPTTSNSSSSNIAKIATYDIKNDVAVIRQENINFSDGLISSEIVQHGTNSGLARSLLCKTDAVKNAPLYNGNNYKFSVTMYSYDENPLSAIRSWESSYYSSMVTVIPQRTAPGMRLAFEPADTLTLIVHSGNSTGLLVLAMDPLNMNDAEYDIKITNSDAGGFTYQLLRSDNRHPLFEENIDATTWRQSPVIEGVVLEFTGEEMLAEGDHFSFRTIAPIYNPTVAASDVAKNVTVVPNPYFFNQDNDLTRVKDYITFTNLPLKAIIKIFDLAGNHVATIEKDNEEQRARWNFLNHDGRLIATGLYIAHIDMPDIDATKILKFLIVH